MEGCKHKLEIAGEQFLSELSSFQIFLPTMKNYKNVLTIKIIINLNVRNRKIISGLEVQCCLKHNVHKCKIINQFCSFLITKTFLL